MAGRFGRFVLATCVSRPTFSQPPAQAGQPSNFIQSLNGHRSSNVRTSYSVRHGLFAANHRSSSMGSYLLILSAMVMGGLSPVPVRGGLQLLRRQLIGRWVMCGPVGAERGKEGGGHERRARV